MVRYVQLGGWTLYLGTDLVGELDGGWGEENRDVSLMKTWNSRWSSEDPGEEIAVSHQQAQTVGQKNLRVANPVGPHLRWVQREVERHFRSIFWIFRLHWLLYETLNWGKLSFKASYTGDLSCRRHNHSTDKKLVIHRPAWKVSPHRYTVFLAQPQASYDWQLSEIPDKVHDPMNPEIYPIPLERWETSPSIKSTCESKILFWKE